MNGQELSSVADTPDFVTYQVTTLDGDSMSLTVETAAGVWWSFNLKRVSTSPLKGNWKLDGTGLQVWAHQRVAPNGGRRLRQIAPAGMTILCTLALTVPS